MNRQEAFEKAYADAHNLPLETFAQYRMGDTYRLPLIAKCWRFWNLALDSVVITVPDLVNCGEDMGCAFIKSIEAAGLKVGS